MIVEYDRFEILNLAERAARDFEKKVKQYGAPLKEKPGIMQGRNNLSYKIKQMEEKIVTFHHGELTLIDPNRVKVPSKSNFKQDPLSWEVYKLAWSICEFSIKSKNPSEIDLIESLFKNAVGKTLKKIRGGINNEARERIGISYPEPINWQDVPDIHDEGFVKPASDYLMERILISLEADKNRDDRIPLFQDGSYLGDISPKSLLSLRKNWQYDDRFVSELVESVLENLKLKLGHDSKVKKWQKKWAEQFSDQLKELAKHYVCEAIETRSSYGS